MLDAGGEIGRRNAADRRAQARDIAARMDDVAGAPEPEIGPTARRRDAARLQHALDRQVELDETRADPGADVEDASLAGDAVAADPGDDGGEIADEAEIARRAAVAIEYRSLAADDGVDPTRD